MKDFNYRVRAAVEADLPSLTELAWEQLQFHARLAPRWIQPYGKEQFKGQWIPYGGRFIANPDRLIVVAEADSSLLGYLAGKVETQPPVIQGGNRLVVDDLYVLEEHRGKGIGGALLEQSYRWARELGADRVALGVMFENVRARSFYARSGFDTLELRLIKSL